MYNQEGAGSTASNQSFTLAPENGAEESFFAQAADYVTSNLMVIGAVAVFVGAALIKGIIKFVKQRIMLKKSRQKQTPDISLAASGSKQEKDARDEALKQKKKHQQQLAEQHKRFVIAQEQAEAADREEMAARENVIEKVYSLDWNRDGFSEPMEQYSSNIAGTRSVASMFYGDDARQEIAALLSSIITMHRQGMSDVQISRILASTKLLNPNIDSRTMQEAADFYLKILEEFNLSSDVSRYSGQINTYELPHTDKEVMRSLAKGDLTPFMDIFDSLAEYKHQKAESLPSGHLYSSLQSEAADLKVLQSRLLFAEDASLSFAKANEALVLSPSHADAFVQLAEISIAEGKNWEAENYYQEVMAIKDIKTTSSAYQSAKEGLREIAAIKAREENDARLSAYHAALAVTRAEVRRNIHAFFALNEEREISIA
ncbi:MAG: hypothetical protein IKD08_04315 [Alphaproteobacteria bacterium]|nr:hypothetical protein [Alphaproteobacteria bacterium]